MQSLKIPVTQVGLEQSVQQAMKNASRNAVINLGTNSRQINALTQPLGRITGQADEFTKSMEAANARVFAFGASVGIINGVTKAFAALLESTIATEKALTDINVNLQRSSSELNKFGDNLFNLAKLTGQSFQTVADGALELSRQGLDAEKVLARLKDALILSRLSGLDAQKSVEGLTAAINSFSDAGLSSQQILDKLVVVSQKYAVSERDLIEGIKRSASVADQAGVSFDELVGIITTVQERTARGGAVIGNAFKTIFAKIQDTGALNDLDNLGITVTDTAGKILPATKILQNLAVEFESLSQVQQTDIAKKLGGIYQLSNLLAAVKDLGSEQSKYAKIVEISQSAAGEAYKKNAVLNQTLDAIINKTSISAQQLGKTLGEIGLTDNLKNLLNFFGSILDTIQNILTEESAMGQFVRGLVKGIGNILTGPGLALFGAIILKLSKDLVQFGFASLKTFFGIGKAAQEIASVEKSINTILLNNVGLQQKLFELEGNRAGQIKVITNALIEQEAVIRRSASIAKDLAAPSYQVGLRATSGGLRINPENTAAEGYMPAVAKESADIAKGVGGARSSDKPVVIPNFNFGGGKKGSIVAHTGEYAIPNFAGSGGTAIFNRDMVRKMGLPAGAKKITASGGFIPNFAVADNKQYGVSFKQNGEIQFEGPRGFVGGTAYKVASTIIEFHKGKSLLKGISVSESDYEQAVEYTKNHPTAQEKISAERQSKANKYDSLPVINEAMKYGLLVARKTIKPGVKEIYASEDKKISLSSMPDSAFKIRFPYAGILDDRFDAEALEKRFSLQEARESLEEEKRSSGKSYSEKDVVDYAGVLMKTGSPASFSGASMEERLRRAANISMQKIGQRIDLPLNDKLKSLTSGFPPSVKFVEVKNSMSDDNILSMGKKLFDVDEVVQKIIKDSSKAAEQLNASTITKSKKSVAKKLNQRDIDAQFASDKNAKSPLYIDNDILKALGINRESLVSAAQEYSNYNLIAGPPGVGKSFYVEKELGAKAATSASQIKQAIKNKLPIYDVRASDSGIATIANSGKVNRAILLTSSKEQIEANRLSRSQSGSKLFGRSPESTTGAYTDTDPLEALFLQRFGSKASILQRSGSSWTPKPESEYVASSTRNIATTRGAFAPFTVGHEDLVSTALKAGYSPEDIFVSVSRGVSSKYNPKNPSSARTMIYNREFRLAMAKAALKGKIPSENVFLGGRGNTAPYAIQKGGRYIVPNQKGSIGFVGEDKDPDKTRQDFLAGGYGTTQFGQRTSGISGTSAREAIDNALDSLNFTALEKLVSPAVLDLLKKNQSQIKNRKLALEKGLAIDSKSLADLESQNPELYKFNYASGYVPNFSDTRAQLSNLISQFVDSGRRFPDVSQLSASQNELLRSRINEIRLSNGDSSRRSALINSLSSDIESRAGTSVVNSLLPSLSSTVKSNLASLDVSSLASIDDVSLPTQTPNSNVVAKIAEKSGSDLSIIGGKLKVGFLRSRTGNPLFEIAKKIKSKEITSIDAGAIIGPRIPDLIVGLKTLVERLRLKDPSFPRIPIEGYFKPQDLTERMNAKSFKKTMAKNPGVDLRTYKSPWFRAGDDFFFPEDLKNLAKAYKTLGTKSKQDRFVDLKKVFPQGLAEGYIPNFADPLKEAVGREMAAGVSASQIYIDKNPSLKSAANPMGLMVANRRDEPNGGYQGINRAIKEGRNPKTYGAAKGFIPNYADFDITGTPLSQKGGKAVSFKKINEAVNNFVKTLDLTSKDLTIAYEGKSLRNSIKKLTEVNNLDADSKKAVAEAGFAYIKNKQAVQKQEALMPTAPPKDPNDFLQKFLLLQTSVAALTGVFDQLGETGQKVGAGLTEVLGGAYGFIELGKMKESQPVSKLGKSLEGFAEARKQGKRGADLASSAADIAAVAGEGLGGKGLSKLASASTKAGAIGRIAGGTLGVIAKVGPLFGKMVPILGQVITGYQVLSGLFKTFGYDLDKILMDAAKGFARAVNLMDTEAEAAAKSLSKINTERAAAFRKGEFDRSQSGLGQFLSTYMSESEKDNLKKKYNIGKDANESEYADAALKQQMEYLTFKQNKSYLAAQAGLTENQLQAQYTEGGPTALQREVNYARIFPEEQKRATEYFTGYKGLSDLQFKALDTFTQDFIAQFSSPEAQAKFAEATKMGLKTEEELRPFLDDLFNSAKQNAPQGTYEKVRTQITALGDFDDATQKRETAKLLAETNKQSNKFAKENNTINFVSAQIAEQKLDNAIKYKLALMEIDDINNAQLSIEKELSSTTDARKIEIERELSARKNALELTKQQASAAAEFLKNQDLLKDALGTELAGKVDEKKYQQFSDLISSITQEIINQGGYNDKIKESLERQVMHLFDSETAVIKISTLFDGLLGPMADMNRLAQIQNDVARQTNAIIDARKLILDNERKAQLNVIDLQKESIDLDQKRLDISDRLFKNRAENLKSIAPRGMQDEIDNLVNSRERSSIIKQGENQQASIFKNLQKELLSTALEKNFGQGLVGSISKASSIEDLKNLGPSILKAENEAAVAKLNAAFKDQKIVTDGADYFSNAVKNAADYLSKMIGVDLDSLIKKAQSDVENADSYEKQGEAQFALEILKQRKENLSGEMGVDAVATAKNNLENDRINAIKALESNKFSESVSKINSAINEAGIASQETIAQLEALDPAFRDASKNLEKQFDKLMLSFSSSMAAKERENIALSGRMERLSMQKDFELQNPANFAGITDPQEYLQRQQQLEKEFFDKNQKLELEKLTREAEIQFKTEQMTLENIKETSANTQALKDLRDALLKDIPALEGGTQPIANVNPKDIPGAIKIASSKLYGSKIQESQAQRFFGKSSEQITNQDWDNLAYTLAKKESSLNPNTTFQESFSDKKGQKVISTGLFQLSEESARGWANKLGMTQYSNVTTEQLKDPAINAELAGSIMKSLVNEQGLIAGQGNRGAYSGLSAYWSPFRKNNFNTQEANYFNNPTTDKTDQAWMEIKKLSNLSGDLSNAALKAAEALGYSGDVAVKEAQKLQAEAETLRNNTANQQQQKETFGYSQSLARIQANPRSFVEGLDSGFLAINEQRSKFKYELGTEIPQMFAANMADAMQKAIEGGESFGDVLQGAAYNFVKEINSKLMSNLANDVVGGFGNIFGGGTGFMKFFGMASGGPIVGGSGNKDDVPAMLMGGEFVINKKAAQKYGMDFLTALNNGSISGYAKGGKVQSGGKGNYFTPGQYNLGGISGAKNLLDFASQAYTGGSRDQMVNKGSYAAIALEAESARLTNFGRRTGPAAEALRSAKGEALGLYLQDYRAKEELRKEQKAQDKAFRNQLIVMAASMAGGAVIGAGSAGFANAAKGASNQGFWASMSAGAKGVWSGGNIGGSNYGGLKNLFSGNFAASQIGSSSDLINYINKNPQSDLTKSFYANMPTNIPRAIPVRATGGSIPSASGIDTIPTMLSGGEFIMNRAAAQNIGSGNLQALNSGARSLPTEEKSEELNDRLIAKLDELIEASGSGSNITINVESSGKETQNAEGNPAEAKQQLARQIRDAVLKVIQEEKRLGGQLRR